MSPKGRPEGEYRSAEHEGSAVNALPGARADADLPLVQATMRVNTLIFCLIFGAMAGLALFVLGLAATAPAGNHARFAVGLLGVFLPGFAPSWPGAFAGAFWGVLIGGALGGGIYWINCRTTLTRVDELVALASTSRDFPLAILRLHGPALGLAVGSIGALGLLATTNWLVLRGTAAESVHARLLSQYLPGYDVSVAGSLIGAIELFAILYVFCAAFASLYNRGVAIRHRHA